ncbi:TetR/AcrR family transcriptional regulator [Leucobacter sp. NPDC058333]|uniref:TetR/AcrR family transcriptional regulator n=1 Tax=Leucobacter sp. NPDC058333 TaxID=3346450 RepID=UPI003652E93F
MSPTPDAKRPAGRPRSALLSRDRILQAAFALSDEQGGEFTLAAVARSLGVRPQALHYYFPSREALVAAMRGQLTLRIGDHGFIDRPWFEAVHGWAFAYRETLGRHSGLIAALATLPVAGEPESIADYERIAASFARDGYPEHLILPAIVALESFIIGSALDALAPADNLRPHGGAAQAPVLAAAEQSASRAAAAAESSVIDLTFTFGLRALVAGIREAGAVTTSGSEAH